MVANESQKKSPKTQSIEWIVWLAKIEWAELQMKSVINNDGGSCFVMQHINEWRALSSKMARIVVWA